MLQLASTEKAYLIDFWRIKSAKYLDSALQKIFKRSILLGFGFSSDMMILKNSVPTMSFFKKIPSFIDLQKEFSRLKDNKNKTTALSTVVEELTGKKMCKLEAFSNWERRPLR